MRFGEEDRPRMPGLSGCVRNQERELYRKEGPGRARGVDCGSQKEAPLITTTVCIEFGNGLLRERRRQTGSSFRVFRAGTQGRVSVYPRKTNVARQVYL